MLFYRREKLRIRMNSRDNIDVYKKLDKTESNSITIALYICKPHYQDSTNLPTLTTFPSSSLSRLTS